MPELVTFLAAAFMYGVLMFGTGWFLCQLQQQHRADIARDREWDREYLGGADRDDPRSW